MDERFSQPEDWPEPFRLSGEEPGAMTEIELGHRVRVTAALAREAA
jgi:peptide/nickel transport system ATP-binding protein